MWGYIVGGFVAAMVVPSVVKVGTKAIWQVVRPKLMGYIGERKVHKRLKKFKGEAFAPLKDVMLTSRNGSSQIDNILVSRQGVFVFEVKNYSGLVVGDEDSPKWKQVYPNGIQREFFNPIWQNNGHIRALKALLGNSFSNVPFCNVVVFGDQCEVMPVGGVVKMKNLKKFLNEVAKDVPVLNEKEVSAIQKCIEKNKIKGRGQRTQHVEYAKQAANKAKEREVAEVRRLRAEANKGIAMKVQNLYSDGFLSIDDAIAEAKKVTTKPVQAVNAVNKER